MAVKPLSIKENIAWNSSGSLFLLACQWLTTIFVVRLSMGYDDAGLLSLAMSVVGVFGTFANYKMGIYQISDVKHEHTVGEYFGFRCITLGIAFVACILYALLTCPLSALVTIILFFLYKAGGLLIDILHGLDQQHRRMDYIGKSFFLQGITSLLAFVSVYFFSGSLNLAIAAMLTTTIIILFSFDLPRSNQFERLVVRINKEKTLYFFRTAFPAVVASLAASAIFTIPKQYLYVLFGDASLGIYSSVAAPALVIQMGAFYLYTPLLSIFPKLFYEGQKREFKKLFFKTVIGIFAVAMATSVALVFVGPWALQLLFGESIVPYVYLLQPIILATAATAYLWFFGDLLIALRNFKANLIGNLIAFIAVIPLSFLCVNIWDMNGVSFAAAIACMLGVACLVVFFGKTFKRMPTGVYPYTKSK